MFYIISYALLVFSTICFVLRVDSNAIFTVNIVAYIVQLISFLRKTNSNEDILKGHYFRPFYIVLLGMLIVNFQTILNVLLGYGPFESFVRYRSLIASYMGPCLYLGVISNVLVTLGYCRKYIPTGNADSTPSITLISNKVCTIFLVLSFVAFIYFIDVASFISGASYVGSGASDRKAETSAYFEQLLWVFLYIQIAVCTYRGSKEDSICSSSTFVGLYPKIFWIILIIYLMLKMFGGDRGPIAYYFIVMAFAYTYYTRKLFSLKTIIVAGIASAFFMTILNMTRGSDLDDSFSERINNSVASYSDMKYSNSMLPATQELANSIECTAYSVALVDQDSKYLGWGVYDLYTLFSSIPGSNTIIRFFIPNFNPREYMPGEYFTTACFGNDYPLGLGSSAVATEYFNGGLLFIFLLMPLFGYMFRRIDCVMLCEYSAHSFIAFLFCLIMSARSIYICRSSFSANLAFAFYVIIIYFVIYKVIRIRD